MSEQATATQVLGADPVLAGQRIRQAREQAGLHVVALAAALKVPVHKLEALETGRLEQLPDATFARALASSVCRHLKIDPTDILAALPQVAQSRLGDAHPLNTPFRSPRDGAPVSATGRAVRGPLAAALALLVGAALVWWWVPQPKERESASATTSEPGTPMGSVTSVREEAANGAAPAAAAPVSEPAGSSPAAPAVPAPAAAVAAPASPASAAPAVAASAPATVSSATGAPPPPTAVPAPAPVATVPGTAPAADTTAGWLVVQASADTWVEVRAGSRVVAQRLIKSGERLALSEAGPLSLVIGNAGATQVLVRGQALDLASLSRNNVARLEVK